MSDTEKKSPKTAEYTLLPGRNLRTIVDGDSVVKTGGETVELTEAQARAFSDLLEKPKKPAPAEEPEKSEKSEKPKVTPATQTTPPAKTGGSTPGTNTTNNSGTTTPAASTKPAGATT